MSSEAKIPVVNAQQLIGMLERKAEPFLLDIRDDSEYIPWHLPLMNHVELSDISQNLDKFPKNRLIVTVCNRGNDSRITAGTLRRNGFQAASLEGGLKGLNSRYDAVKVMSSDRGKLAVYQVKRLWKGCLAYIIVVDGQAIVVDPSRHTEFIKEFMSKNELKLAAVLDTHIHADHISGGLALSREYLADYFLPEKSKVDFGFKDLKLIDRVVKNANFRIIPSPGHTQESVCILLNDKFLFTGDTLFLNSVGRSDLGQKLEDNARILYEIIKDRIFPMDGMLKVLPAHNQKPMWKGESPVWAFLGKVKRQNDISKFRKTSEFVKAVGRSQLPTPKNFLRIKEINQTGRVPSWDLDELEFGANRCAVKV